jgi:hypothetical protein
MSTSNHDRGKPIIAPAIDPSVQAGEEESNADLHIRIVISVTLLDPAEPVAVPLGAYRDGRWQPLSPSARIFEMSADNLADELSADNLIGDLLMMNREELLELLRHTDGRRRALAEASVVDRSSYDDPPIH